ncbi:glycosylated lysosomal membrane protein B-like [Melitaea cinxia]|uniref:glycosylated lysosomal membrane protein B-like n=1 Tax=Melitaea cinxia TaxID=113334 RepID=UPI001E270376|nr:glycosylated lysosomal membrane protein B-like [Melitaea cinxia]
MNIQTVLIFIGLSFAYGQDRKITAKLNPGYNTLSSDVTLVYVKCEGVSDTIHQIWDFTRHMPTVIFAVTSVNSTLNVTWTDNVPKNLILSEEPTYSFATAIDKVYEYDDLDDNGHIDPKFPQKPYPLDRIVWNLNESLLTDKEAMVHVYGTLNDRHGRQETIHIKLDLIPFKDYAVDLPHLIHTANSTLFDISLVNLTTSKEYNASRYAIHLLLVSTDPETDTMHYTMRKSLDDEHTPGVFEIIEIKSPSLFEEGEGGYLQFRPVAYLQSTRGVASSAIARVSAFNRTYLPRHSTLKLFYSRLNTDLLVQDMFVSFGEAGDGYYKQHNYTAWSFTIGYGTPPVESFSFFVIMIISIGLGVPVVLALSGITYVLLRRYRQRNNRTRFTNED